jgi:Protein of unknown function (DUF993)
MSSIILPTTNGRLETYRMSQARAFEVLTNGSAPRIAYAAVHVVADPLAVCDPWLDAAIDWDKTIEYRHYLWGLGLGVAEAMDTAQRGGGVNWTSSLELIKRSVSAAREFTASTGREALLASGAGTDHLDLSQHHDIDAVIKAYEEQCSAIEKAGGRIVLMASRALAACAKSRDDYIRVYNHVLSQVAQPVIIHWLGDMFDPALAGYWGHDDLNLAMEVCLDVLRQNADKIVGIKISLLDDQKEIAMRKRLPEGMAMYTGDDFNFARLIAGDQEGYSDALLGIFDAIAPAASAALQAMAKQDMAGYWDILEPMVPLSRHIFQNPTRFYKTGIVFLAYLNGHQDHFLLVGGQESARSTLNLAELFRLADRAGILRDSESARIRMGRVMTLHGVGA